MIFYEDKHEYIEVDEPYTSMTTFIDKFKHKEDWEEIAKKYAKKNGNTWQYWLNKWNLNKENSARVGSIVHRRKEDEAYREPGWNHIQVNEKGNKKIGLDLSNLSPGLYPELIVYDHKYKIAGQADRVIITQGKKVHIKDYKTSKEIKKEPIIYFDVDKKRRVRKRLLPPVSHLDANNFSTYSLQLSGYGFILERWGYKIASLEIIHLKMKGRQDPDFFEKGIYEIEEEVVYPVPYLRREVQMMFLRNLARLKI